MIRSSLLLPLLLAVVALAPRPAGAAENFDNCTGMVSALPAVIPTSGTWCLGAHLATAATTGIAVLIAADDVVLDCNDFKIDGTAAGAGTQTFGIYAQGRTDVTVRNCNVRGFYFGITLAGGGGHLVEDNRLDANTFVGVRVDGARATVRGNHVADTGGSTVYPAAFGVFVMSPAADVLGNRVSGVTARVGGNGSAYGIYTGGNTSGTVNDNRVGRVVRDGSGSAYGVFNNESGRLIVRGNDIAGAGTAGSLGLRCSTLDASARDNTIQGFSAGISGCSNDGNNVYVP